MKKLKIVLFSVLTLGLALTTSCGDDDSSSNNTSGALEGKWIYAKEGMAAQGQEILNDYEHTEGCSKDYLEILESTANDVTYWGSECDQTIDESTYTRNGNTLTVTSDGQTETVTIEKLTGSELKISISETMEGTTVKYITTFTRG